MREYETGAVRDTGGKGRMDLLPWSAIMRVSRHMEAGSVEHGERNWEKGLPLHCFIDSAFRHLAKYMEGQTDEDHLCAAAWNTLCAMWTEENLPGMMDIPSRVNPTSKDPGPEERALCGCYDKEQGRCNGTKERDLCSCNGVTSFCDFYSGADIPSED